MCVCIYYRVIHTQRTYRVLRYYTYYVLRVYNEYASRENGIILRGIWYINNRRIIVFKNRYVYEIVPE